MKLYLARHGESEGNAKRLFFGQTDCPLTERGLEQANELRQKLSGIKLDACYTSMLARAFQTARICMEGRATPIVQLFELNEQHMGHMEGLAYDEALERFPAETEGMLKAWTKCPPAGGEPFKAIQARTLRFLENILLKNEDALLVSHNGPLSIILTHLLGLEDEKVSLFWLAHGSYSMLEINEHGAKLRCFNK